MPLRGLSRPESGANSFRVFEQSGNEKEGFLVTAPARSKGAQPILKETESMPMGASLDPTPQPTDNAAISRRTALRKISAGAEMGALVAPALTFAFGGKSEQSEIARLSAQGPSRESAAYPKTDERCTFPDGVAFQNLGVMHHPAFLSAYSGVIRERVRSADVVLLEASKRIIKQDPFWKNIAAESLTLGKRVYYVDNQRLVPAATQLFGSMLLSAAAAAGLALSHPSRPQHASSSNSWSRRGALRATLRGLGWLGYLSAPLAPTTTVPEKMGARAVWDTSFSQDARTVGMLSDTYRLAAQHQGQPVLLISGESHARHYSFYAKNPEVLRAKEAIYQRVYFSWLRDGPSVVESSDLK